MPAPTFVLIHSPLVGPYTWSLVADELRAKSFQVVIPVLDSAEKKRSTYWEQHAIAVSDALHAVTPDSAAILVAHSGAGPLLHAVRLMMREAPAAYIFVDAGLPQPGKSRLDMFNDRAATDQFRQSAQNGLIPLWTEEDLREVIPNDAVRHRFAQELTPLPLEVYEEPLPGSPNWPDAPCAYLRFGSNPAYDESYRQAQHLKWETEQINGDHFHMLEDPAAVANHLIDLAKRVNRLLIE